MSAPNGAELIAAERQRQIDAEGWTAEHDDTHEDEQLSYVAAWLCAPNSSYVVLDNGRDKDYEGPHGYYRLWKPSWNITCRSRVDALTKAGALIAAEIDRLQRARVER